MDAACDALVAGLDTRRFPRRLHTRQGGHDVHVLLHAALDAVGLTFYPVGNEAGQEAAARSPAHRILAAELTPREFTFPITDCLLTRPFKLVTDSPASRT